MNISHCSELLGKLTLKSPDPDMCGSKNVCYCKYITCAIIFICVLEWLCAGIWTLLHQCHISSLFGHGVLTFWNPDLTKWGQDRGWGLVVPSWTASRQLEKQSFKYTWFRKLQKRRHSCHWKCTLWLGKCSHFMQHFLHIHNIRNLHLPVLFLIAMKFRLWALLMYHGCTVDDMCRHSYMIYMLP